MTDVFGKTYADAYDALYQAKDYEGEVRILEQVFEKYGSASIRRVVDLGCGTGNHALRLAARSFDVVGVDRSAQMLACAEEKAYQEGLKIRFHRAAICDFHLDEEFDTALMMFAVLGYHHSNREVLKALRAARSCLRRGGIFTFDVWYGPAVLTQKPSERINVVENGDGTIIRTAKGRLSTPEHLCQIDYHVWRIRGDKVEDEATEAHTMRYFFPKELELFLSLTGFEMLRLAAFPDFEREPDVSTWNVLVVARAV